MKRADHLISVAILLAGLFSASAVIGQEKLVEGQAPVTQRPNATNQPDVRTATLRQLGLSNVQLQQIRRINIERKPLMDAAQRRLSQSNRLLDEIIYADNARDADIQARLKDFQLAQAEVSKIRFMNELAVRRILTPEQLVRFRQMRQRFEQVRNNAERRQQTDRQTINRPPNQNFIKQNQKNPRF